LHSDAIRAVCGVDCPIRLKRQSPETAVTMPQRQHRAIPALDSAILCKIPRTGNCAFDLIIGLGLTDLIFNHWLRGTSRKRDQRRDAKYPQKHVFQSLRLDV
jgi:hypothetical protein